ncbi:MAG: hypothetical protein AAF404_07575 [Pseudomonadota bacterium]
MLKTETAAPGSLIWMGHYGFFWPWLRAGRGNRRLKSLSWRFLGSTLIKARRLRIAGNRLAIDRSEGCGLKNNLEEI